MHQKKNVRHIWFAWWFLGAYMLMLAMIFWHVFTSEGDMAGLLISMAAIPWSIIGNRLFDGNGLIAGTLVGLVINGMCAFFVGYYFDRRRCRSN